MVGAIYFSAPWCGPCRTFGPVMDEVASELGVDVQKVNVDEDTALASEYGVMSIPATVWYKDGVFRKFQPGPMSKTSLLSLIATL